MTMSDDKFDFLWSVQALDAQLLDHDELVYDEVSGQLSLELDHSPKLADVLMVAPVEVTPLVVGVSRELWAPVALERAVDEVLHDEALDWAAQDEEVEAVEDVEDVEEVALTQAPVERAEPVDEWALWSASLLEQSRDDGASELELFWDESLDEAHDDLFAREQESLAKVPERETRVSHDSYVRMLLERLRQTVDLSRHEAAALRRMAAYSGNVSATLKRVVSLLEEGWEVDQLEVAQQVLLAWHERHNVTLSWGLVLRVMERFRGLPDEDEVLLHLESLQYHHARLMDRLERCVDCRWDGVNRSKSKSRDERDGGFSLSSVDSPDVHLSNFLSEHALHMLSDVAWVEPLVELDLEGLPQARRHGAGEHEERMRTMMRRQCSWREVWEV